MSTLKCMLNGVKYFLDYNLHNHNDVDTSTFNTCYFIKTTIKLKHEGINASKRLPFTGE